MVNQHLAGKGCYDFAIIATGINDIDIENSPPTTLTNHVADQTKAIVDVAENLVSENNIDIFIVDKPPRYDPSEKDSTGMYSKLSKYSNGVLASSVGMTPRLFIVDQSNLARSGTKARSDIFKSDGLLLTNKGLSFYTSSIIKSLTDCYPEMSVPRRPNPLTQGHDHGQGGGRNDGGRAGQGQGRRSDHRDGRDRQHQDRSGYGYLVATHTHTRTTHHHHHQGGTEVVAVVPGSRGPGGVITGIVNNTEVTIGAIEDIRF